ncbi:hypothetical protein Q3C01_30795 [Bradyrhizobium sp. UFLA05-109]
MMESSGSIKTLQQFVNAAGTATVKLVRRTREVTDALGKSWIVTIGYAVVINSTDNYSTFYPYEDRAEAAACCMDVVQDGSEIDTERVAAAR